MEPVIRTKKDGLVVGLIAYASVAVFYSAFDLFAARGSLYTVDLLGKAVFRGLRDPNVLQYPIQPDWMSIFWYNGLHLVTSLAIGLVVVALIEQAERHPARARLVFAAIVAGFVVTVLGVGAATESFRPLVPWWSIVVANGFATLLAGAYVMKRNPGVWRLMVPAAG